VSSPADLRNVVLVGSAGSGKTTLFENLLKARVAGYRGEKDDPERLAALSLATISGEGAVINILDAPGHPDFVSELRAGVRAADAAVFVVSAADGVDTTAQVLWAELKAAGIPRAVVVTKLDAEHSDYDAAVEQIRAAFGEGVHPGYIPLRDGKGEIIGNLSLLTRRTHDYSSGSRVARDATDEEKELIENYRADYVESIITDAEDEELMDLYLGDEELPTAEMVQDLMKAMYHGNFYPVIPVLTSGVGVEELIGVISKGFPMPTRRVLPPLVTPAGDEATVDEISADGPLLAQVIRTVSDPFAGRLSMVRVFSGTLKTDATAQIIGGRKLFGLPVQDAHPDHSETEKVGALSAPAGQELTGKSQALAGEIVYVAKLSKAETGDTISSPEKPLVVRPWATPTPLLPAAVRAASRNDEDKLATALGRLVVEDTSVVLQRAEGTDQLLLWTMGQAHYDLLMNRLKDRYGVNVEPEAVKIAYRETFVGKGAAEYTHKKQSGGHGQYAKASIEIEPLERGGGFEFADQVVGGAIPRTFIPSVETGVRSQLEKGVLAGYPLVDVKVTLLDGKYHPVDSSDMAFQLAGSMAVKEAAKPGTVALLEPIDLVTITVGEQYQGAIMTDISGRRGQMLGSDSAGDHKAVIRALIPQAELMRYAIDLRGLAQGSGSFTREFHGYELVPAQTAAEIVAAASKA
jgi:elongation factor G